ncbi:MAG: putative Nudix hydrolase NudL [Firmicutes bacterium]|nr:putative Nudix hydrolase NudL [Bacillota bacterium]
MKENIRGILKGREKKYISDPGLISSAVLVPIYEKDSEYYIIFTKRTETVEYHKGQISFPGGRKDKSDSCLLATALRESFEEIALQPEVVEILGELDDETTISTSFVVSPFVGFILYPYDFEINREEVEEVMEIPLAALRDKVSFHEETITSKGKTLTTCFYHYGDQVI